MFSELGNLLKPRKRKIGPQLLAAIQLIQSWVKAGVVLPTERKTEACSDKQIAEKFDVCNWDHSPL
ncbi:hypothetical protein EJ02DRAFT_362007 [Clathrospora elynae]|uniref:Uncharacterized protein n=1 Tax=Clathrospora elynae TaxID=706981 RepID=A0A6A5S523_9PLEO|nr:hypothetical protein EJ02DRAFT_362007 [Clathrospora elynae]